MFEIRLKRNPAFGEESEDVPRYFFEVDLGKVTKEKRKALVPIHWRPTQSLHVLLKEIYWADIAGIKIEKGNLQALMQSVKDTLLPLIKGNALPRYFLSWLSGGGLVPVYFRDKKLQVHLGEVQLGSSSIGQLRSNVAEYLIATRKIKRPEDLTIHVLSLGDLQLHLPNSVLFYPGASDIWIPVFYEEHERGKVLAVDYQSLPIMNGQLSPEAEQDVFELRHQVAEDLISMGKITDRLNLRIGYISEQTWHSWQKPLVPKNMVLTYHSDQATGAAGKVQIPIYLNKNEYIAAHKEGNDRYRLCFGRDEQDLRRRIAEELAREGVIPSSDWLTIEYIARRG